MRTLGERRSRARRGEGDRLREEILAATERLLIETGDQASVSIRSIAEKVGCTPPAIYMHFADKSELIFAVCQRHFDALNAVVREAAARTDDPVGALRGGSLAYVRFGLEHPEQYRVIFMGRPGATHVPAEKVRSAAGFGFVVDSVRRCIEAGAFTDGDPFFIATGLWTALHGITSLLIAKPRFPWPRRAGLIEHCVDTHIKGLRRD